MGRSLQNVYLYKSELPQIIATNFPVDKHRCGIFGHSMGGHGALMIGLRNHQQFRSLSAFAPICAPTQSSWGIHAFRNLFRGNKRPGSNMMHVT